MKISIFNAYSVLGCCASVDLQGWNFKRWAFSSYPYDDIWLDYVQIVWVLCMVTNKTKGEQLRSGKEARFFFFFASYCFSTCTYFDFPSKHTHPAHLKWHELCVYMRTCSFAETVWSLTLIMYLKCILFLIVGGFSQKDQSYNLQQIYKQG